MRSRGKFDEVNERTRVIVMQVSCYFHEIAFYVWYYKKFYVFTRVMKIYKKQRKLKRSMDGE